MSRLIYQSIEILEIKTSILFNFVFANSTILLCLSLFVFLVIDLCLLIPAVIPEIVIPAAELAIPKGNQLMRHIQEMKHNH